MQRAPPTDVVTFMSYEWIRMDRREKGKGGVKMHGRIEGRNDRRQDEMTDRKKKGRNESEWNDGRKIGRMNE